MASILVVEDSLAMRHGHARDEGIDLVQSLRGVLLCRIVKPFDLEVLRGTLKKVL